MGMHAKASGPDFSAGFPLDSIPENGTIAGRDGDTPVLASRIGGDLFAVSGVCTHYGAALAEGLIAAGEVRCPLHHACFSLRSGAVVAAPALDPLDRWRVEIAGGRLFIREKLEPAIAPVAPTEDEVRRILIVGGGAAGLACASELRRLGFGGSITMLSAERDPPCDRPNLSKDFLAGTAPAEWLPLRGNGWYGANGIDLHLDCEAERIDPDKREVHLLSGESVPFDRLLIATGSEPNKLKGAGFDSEKVVLLRTLADAISVGELARPGAKAAIAGSSFIGMEAAAALRQRGVAVRVVSPAKLPFLGVFGEEIGAWLRRLHETNGVEFHLGTVASSFEEGALHLANGDRLEADFVLVGVGVRPRNELAKTAGMPGDKGVPVNAFLETCCPGIFAAGDIAEYPDPLTGEDRRIEHWVTAQRQGQVAAANMLGQARRFEAVPFFWTEQFGVSVRYVGHAPQWDRVEIEGDVEARDFIARFYDQGVHRASAAVGRDRAILEDERMFELQIAQSRNGAEPPTTGGIQSPAQPLEAMRGS